MPETRPDQPVPETPANQADESKGRIKRPQDNNTKNLPQGSEPETHARK